MTLINSNKNDDNSCLFHDVIILRVYGIMTSVPFDGYTS